MGRHKHLLLSRKSWEELEQVKRKCNLPGDIPKSYEEYLKEQKLNPTMVYCA